MSRVRIPSPGIVQIGYGCTPHVEVPRHSDGTLDPGLVSVVHRTWTLKIPTSLRKRVCNCKLIHCKHLGHRGKRPDISIPKENRNNKVCKMQTRRIEGKPTWDRSTGQRRWLWSSCGGLPRTYTKLQTLPKQQCCKYSMETEGSQKKKKNKEENLTSIVFLCCL